MPPGQGAPPPGGGYPPPQQHYGGGYAPPAASPQFPVAAPAAVLKQQAGFFGSMFDLSFNNFVATRIIKVLYVLFLILIALGVLAGLGAAVFALINGEVLQALLMLVLLPFVVLVELILARMWAELVIVTFRIAENVQEINHKTKG
jgi:hypothetical protein